ncbi:MAG TPA: hypothetical protein VND96_11785 [Candidatus Micrarchaeaceae archaeon]|nr:hypothetical protein [Candidatus Micrarchaeaceae archaeon]
MRERDLAGPGGPEPGRAGLHTWYGRHSFRHSNADRHTERDAGGSAVAFPGSIADTVPGSVTIAGSVSARRLAGTVSIKGWNRRSMTAS